MASKLTEHSPTLPGETHEEKMRRLYPTLKRPDDFTPEERVARAKKAHAAAAANHQRRKAQRDILNQILQMECTDEGRAKYLQQLGLDGTNSDAMNFALVERAVAKGEVEDLRYIRDTIGEKPVDQNAISILEKPVDTIDMSELSDAELDALAEFKG